MSVLDIFKKSLVVVSAVLVTAGLGGCVFDRTDVGPVPGGKEDKPLEFTVSVPGMRTPSTRGFGEAREHEVVDIDMVFYDAASGAISRYIHVAGSDVGPVQGNNDYKFLVREDIDIDDDSLRAIVIANATQQVSEALAAISVNNVYTGANIKDFLFSLRYTNNHKWFTGETNYKPIPMCGQMSTFTPGSTSDLTRMLAKVDVINDIAPANPELPANGKFELTAVHVVNYNTKSLISPRWENYMGGAVIVESDPLYLPNFPNGFDPETKTWNDGNELVYTLSYGQTSLSGDIYLFESLAGYEADENPSAPNTGTPAGVRLVMEGNWTSGGVTEHYYYPVDFINTPLSDGASRYMPVLRNHRYVFTITGASGRGYDSLGEAVSSYSVESNLKTRLISYNEGELRNIVFDGQYMLGVDNKDNEIMSPQAQELTVKLFADNPNGWEAVIDDADDNTWIRFSGNRTSVTGSPLSTEFTLSLDAFNPGQYDPQTRTAAITVTSGRLDMKVTFTQTLPNDYYSIRIVDDNGNDITGLLFGYGVREPIDAQRFYVLWSGADRCSITFSTESGDIPFEYGVLSDKPSGNISGGMQMYSIVPSRVVYYELEADPSLVKRSKLTFTVRGAGGNTISKDLILQQSDTDLIAEIEPCYPMDGQLHNFVVKCGSAWEAYLVDDGGVLSFPPVSTTVPFATGGHNLPSGTDVSFRTITYNSLKLGVAKVRFVWTAVDGSSKELTEDIVVVGDGDPEENFPSDLSGRMYVGAFWKSSQKGERLIRIERALNGSMDGDWTAVVHWKDGNWGNAGIVLDKLPSNDPNIGWNGGNERLVADMNNLANDRTYSVPGYAASVSGTLNASNSEIYFRIGLTDTYTPTADAPCRYGVIVLSFGDHSYQSKIYIRQGEDGDYLMRPQDPIIGEEYNSPSRPQARKFSPYNITSQEYIDGTKTGGYSIDDHSQLVRRGGVPVEYPSQAGALFCWANTGRPRWAYHPVNPNGYDSDHRIVGWVQESNYKYNFWEYYGPDHEVCPPGWRRPNDGSTGAVVPAPGSFEGSEVRQSLFFDYKTGYMTRQNSLLGYYADGFFDRRQIVTSVCDTEGSAVSYENANVAYLGRLFYNPYTNSSIFLPLAGYRNDQYGLLFTAGYWGNYQTSSLESASSSLWSEWVLSLWTTSPWMGELKARSAISLRCVRE